MIVNFLIKITLSVPFLFPLSSLHSLHLPSSSTLLLPFSLSLSLSPLRFYCTKKNTHGQQTSYFNYRYDYLFLLLTH